MIEIKSLEKGFKNLEVLKDINCSIPKGSIFGIVGANSAGKSTLLRTIAGIYEPSKGNVFVDGQPVFENTYVKEKIFFVPDLPYFFKHATIKTMAEFYSKLYNNWNYDRYNQLCKDLSLDQNIEILSMSKGMKRQVSIVIAICAQPEYMLLDEIFDGLDPLVREYLKNELLKDVKERNTTILISSHNISSLEEICDHIGMVYKGCITVKKEINKIDNNIHKVQLACTSSFESNVFDNVDILKMQQNGSVLNLIVKGNKEEIIAELNKANPLFIEILPLTLEEMFVFEAEGENYEINRKA